MMRYFDINNRMAAKIDKKDLDAVREYGKHIAMDLYKRRITKKQYLINVSRVVK